jgi:hypothetical protein
VNVSHRAIGNDGRTRPVMGMGHVQLLTVDAGTTFARPGRISTLDHKVLNVKIMSESLEVI